MFKSYDVTGGMHTNGVMLTSKPYHDANPKICAAVLAAQQEANEFIRTNPRQAAEIYLKLTGDKERRWTRWPDGSPILMSSIQPSR